MTDPVSPRLKPYRIDLVDGKDYYWCACGLSRSQPFCDGSHQGTDLGPLKFCADGTGPALLCGCKHSGTGPYCDGSHNNLSNEYETDDRSLEELLASSVTADFDVRGRAQLDGGCYVQRPTGLTWQTTGGLNIATVIGPDDGAKHLSQYAARLASGSTEYLSCNSAAVVIYVIEGAVNLRLGSEKLSLEERTGAYIKPGEAFSLECSEDQSAYCLLCICPGSATLEAAKITRAESSDKPLERSVRYDPDQVETMADRFYQVLVGASVGSHEISQFIGQIPQSKAAPHRHLYEETIFILSGNGVLWTENFRAAVAPGDFIFLPAQQEHSLQCYTEHGMELVGHFYPAGSPAINY